MTANYSYRRFICYTKLHNTRVHTYLEVILRHFRVDKSPTCPLWLEIRNPTLLAKCSFLSGPEGPALLRFILQQRHMDVDTNSPSGTSESLSEIWPHTHHRHVYTCVTFEDFTRTYNHYLETYINPNSAWGDIRYYGIMEYCDILLSYVICYTILNKEQLCDSLEVLVWLISNSFSYLLQCYFSPGWPNRNYRERNQWPTSCA